MWGPQLGMARVNAGLSGMWLGSSIEAVLPTHRNMRDEWGTRLLLIWLVP